MRHACPRCGARGQVAVTAGSKGVRPSGKPPVKHRKDSRGSEAPRVSAAAQLAARLQKGGAAGVTVDDVSRAATQPSHVDELWRLFVAARAAQAQLLDARTCAAVLATCSRGSGWDVRKRVDAVWASAVEAGVSGNAFVRSAYVAALGRVGDVDAAFAAIGRDLAAVDTVTWNALLSATLHTGLFARGLETHAAGLAAGLTPDIATTISHIQLLTASGAPVAGADACEAALLHLAAAPDVTVKEAKVAHLLTAGIAAAGRAGDTTRAWSLYTRFTGSDVKLVATPDAAVFTALIDAAGSDADAAWKAYQEGDARGVKLGGHEPAVCAMLVAFTRAKEPSRAWLFFETIRRAWPGRTPPRVAYLLLRDCAAASNDAAWAVKVAALLAAELGTSTPPGGEPAPGEAAERGAHARPGVAVARFTVGGTTYETRNGEAETALPDADPAKQLLSGAGAALVTALGGAYTPDTSGVSLMAGGPEAQAEALCQHAEKKALGALLIRARGDVVTAVPRVWVSIRMCRDCHAAFGAASRIFGTRVECLDGHTHIFVDGVCSCGNRWR